MTIYDLKTKTLDEFGFKDPLGDYHDPIFIHENKMEGKKMKGKVHEVIKLEDGKYDGKIEKIEYTDKPYEYINVFIKEKGTGLVIKAGYPFYISDNSMMGKMLINFGAKLTAGSDIDYDDYIKVGMDVQFLTKTVKKDDREYCNILLDTVKPQ